MTKTVNNHQVMRSAGRMGFAVMLSRLFGLVREQLFAFYFGASWQADAFLVAYRIPNLFRDLFAEGALSASLVPVFVHVKERIGVFSAWILALRVLGVLFCITSLVSLWGAYGAPELVAFYASSFRSDPAKFELTVGLTQVMFGFFPFISLAAGFMGILNAMGSFFWPSFASALFNVASIATMVFCGFFFPRWNLDPVWGLSIGVVFGGIVQAFSQFPALVKKGLPLSLQAFQEAMRGLFQDTHLKRICLLFVPSVFGTAATQISVLVNTILATSLPVGSVACLNYAFRLMHLPIGLFGVSFSQALLSRVSADYAKKDTASAAQHVQQCLQTVLAINLPAAVGLASLSHLIIKVVFEHGAFSAMSTRMTADVLVMYALGLAFFSLTKVLVPLSYVFGQVRLPLVASFISVAFALLLNVAFVSTLQAPGLALGTSLGSILNSLFMGFGLTKIMAKKGVRLIWADFVSQVAKIAFACGVMGIVLIGFVQALKLLDLSIMRSFLGSCVVLSLLVVCGGATYYCLAHWLGIEAMQEIGQIFRQKFGRTKKRGV
jgi:putative peptidoglycan lipid II flippase